MQQSLARTKSFAFEAKPDLADADDDGLLKLIAAGDKIAMERLFARHRRRVYAGAHRLTGSHPLADEVVSEVFLTVWCSACRFEGKSKVSTWLLAITRNKALAGLRARKELPLDDCNSSSIVDEGDSPEVVVHQLRRAVLLRYYFQRLSPAHRQIVELIYYRNKSIADVARIAGVPEGTVKSRMAAARSRIAEFLCAAGINRFQEC
jgi:RNA polymerase sigma-70 factor, ECF subfamily